MNTNDEATPIPRVEGETAVVTTVYTRPGCRQCTQTVKVLTTKGVPFVEVELSSVPGKVEELREAGNMQAPVIESPVGTWFGFRPDRISELAAVVAA